MQEVWNGNRNWHWKSEGRARGKEGKEEDVGWDSQNACEERRNGGREIVQIANLHRITFTSTTSFPPSFSLLFIFSISYSLLFQPASFFHPLSRNKHISFSYNTSCQSPFLLYIHNLCLTVGFLLLLLPSVCLDHSSLHLQFSRHHFHFPQTERPLQYTLSLPLFSHSLLIQWMKMKKVV